MKKIIFGLFFIEIIFTSFNFFDKVKTENSSKISVINDSSKEKLENQVQQIRKVVQQNPKYNKEIAFFIDMKIPSGKNRFFVYDLKKEVILDQGLVAHGSGSETGIQGKLKFSNTNNSLATSLGKYYIGNFYIGKFGKAYKLYGLDKTNSNAFDRAVVLHKYFDVPYEEQADYICNSYGCPMVNEKYFKRIEKIIDSSKTNILLVIYY
ncbi:murein L,D-transpeptidase catalytic domain-containing protein [Flavobacterium eburneipallidum]|uniref:murein L,D-transpeptidase catalytic domain-containing protein n=1 Tax=Flavobacterium eburneipallidum TaxID=3003263 RepID=UPI0022AC4D01|nr:murein L,D-transpeptidase catalytic domain family protein [Flavobacterium eburneipallidum]